MVTYVNIIICYSWNQFDRFHVYGDRIYKIGMQLQYGDQTVNIGGIKSELGPKVKNHCLPYRNIWEQKTSGMWLLKNAEHQNTKFKEKSFFIADPSILTVFSYPPIRLEIFHSFREFFHFL